MNLTQPDFDPPRDPKNEEPLSSWKEIGAYLQRNAATVRRWEKEEGLPVHRHSHKIRSSVYAYPSEIDAWRLSRKLAPESAPEPAPAPPPSAPPLWKLPAFAATILLCLLMVGNGIRPQVVEAQQGQTRTLVCSGDGCDGAISPDGKSLLANVNGALEIRDIATKKTHRVLEAAGMRLSGWGFSPDGSRVVYSRRPQGPLTDEAIAADEVFVVNVDGTKPRSVFHGGGSLAWSPDGKRLLLEQYRRPTNVSTLLWLDLASGTTQKLPSVHTNLDLAKVSPDGKFIAFNASKDKDSQENVYIMASDGSGEILISPSASYQEPVEWTPDGKNLVFAQFGASVDLWSVPFGGGKIQGPAVNTHVEFPAAVNSFRVDRAGAIYYRTLSSTSDIYTAAMDPSTGKVTSAPTPVPVERTGDNVLPRWAPDSRRLAYVWSEPLATPRYGISIFSFDTGKEQRVAAQANVGGAPSCWSSDGSSLLFNIFEEHRPGRDAVHLNLATNQIAPLFPGTEPFFLRSCSNNLAVSLDGTAVKIRSLLNASEKEIYKPATGLSPPLLSHDGQSVAFVAPNAGTYVLRLIPSEGGPSRDIVTTSPPAQLQGAWGMAWSPDDRFLYFARRADEKSPHELFRVPAAGGVPESVGLKVDDLRDLNITPDGTRIAFSVGATNLPQIWALRRFLPSK